MKILKQKLLRQSEVREKLNALLGLETRTEDQDKELTTLTGEAQKLEPEIRAALVVEGAERQVAEREAAELGSLAGSPEQRERLELRGRARLGRFLASAISGRAVDGVEAEYRSSMGTGDGVPLDLFEQDRPKVLEYAPMRRPLPQRRHRATT